MSDRLQRLKGRRMVVEFVEFLRKTNALAVAVIIGAAIGKVVSSVVNDLLMPVIGLWRRLARLDDPAQESTGREDPLGDRRRQRSQGGRGFDRHRVLRVCRRPRVAQGGRPSTRSGNEDVLGVRREHSRQGYALLVLHELCLRLQLPAPAARAGSRRRAREWDLAGRARV